MPFTLSRQMAVGLYYVQRYRFLTIKQFARAAGLKHASASDQLRSLELGGLLGHFGNTGHPGYGKTPKAYFLTRKGWEHASPGKWDPGGADRSTQGNPCRGTLVASNVPQTSYC